MPAGAHPPESPTLEPGSGPFITAALGLGLLAAAVALGGFVWLGYQVRSGEPTAMDLSLRAWVRSFETPSLTGPDAPTWRRAWALGDTKKRSRQRRRWPKV